MTIVHHDRIAESDKLAQVSLTAYHAYSHLLGCGDDWGRAERNARKIVARLYPRRPTFHAGHVQRLLAEYEKHRLLRTYVVAGVTYFEWTKFRGVQPSRRKYMRVPPPPWASAQEHAWWAELKRGNGTGGGGAAPSCAPTPSLDLFPTLPPPSEMNIEAGHEDPPDDGAPSVPAVPADTTTPPTPPAGAGGPGNLPEALASADQVIAAQVDLAAAYLIRLGGRASRKVRRSMRNDLRAGFTFEELCESLIEVAKQQLVQMGRFDWSKPWPPPDGPDPGNAVEMRGGAL